VRVLGVVLAIAWCTSAFADDKPWAAGVPDKEQAAALAIYRDGNAEFEESRYAQALAKYREAIKHWDHPAIRFNMAVALINLEQPLEAAGHLEAAMKFGAAPLGNDAFAQAVTYKKLLEGQLTHLRVTCETDGADVTLDGKPLLHCKGEATAQLLPGPHQVVASKPGYETETAPLVLLPGKEIVHVVALHPIAVKTRMVRRWSARAPWLVVGAGAGVAAIGGLYEYLAFKDHDSYETALKTMCMVGCPASYDASEKSRARAENIVGVSLLVVGGAGVAAGLVGVYLNLPRAVVEHAPAIAPTPGGAVVSLRWSF
jgi:hypothetical protein